MAFINGIFLSNNWLKLYFMEPNFVTAITHQVLIYSCFLDTRLKCSCKRRFHLYFLARAGVGEGLIVG